MTDHTFFEARPGVSVVVLPNAPAFTIVAVTNDFVRITGLQRPAIIGEQLLRLFPGSSPGSGISGPENLRRALEHVIRYKEPHHLPPYRNDLYHTDGTVTEKFWITHSVPVLSEAGEVQYIIQSSEDVTAQVKAGRQGEAFKGMEMAYRFFLNAPVIIGFINGDDYIIEMANKGLLEVWGRTDDVIGKPLLHAIPELAQQGLIALLDQVRTTGQPFYAQEFPITLNRGGKEEVLYFDFVYNPFYEKEGDSKASGIISVGYDVTAQVVARSKIAESEQKYRNLFESMDQGFCVLEMLFDAENKPLDYQFLETNPVFESQTGLKNAIGKTARQMVPDLESRWFEIYGSVAITGEPVRFTEGSNAMGRWFDVYAFRIGGANSRQVALLFTDITQRKRSDEALRQSKERFDLVAKATQDAIWDWNLHTNQIWWNEGFKELFGYKAEEIEPTIESWYSGLHPDDKQRVIREVHQVIDNGGTNWSGEYRFRRKDGSYAVVFDRGYALHDKEGRPYRMLGSMQDITKQVEYRRVVEESRAQLQLAMEIAELGTFQVDLHSSTGTYTSRIRDWFGFTEDQKELDDIFAAIYPEDRQRVVQAIRQSQVSEESSRHDVTYRVVHPVDGTIRHLRSIGKTFFHEGKAYEIRGVIQDVTAQVRYQQQIEESEALLKQRVTERTQELENLNQELKRSNDSLEEFAYAASHDMKEPIRKILFFSDRLKQELEHQLNGSQSQLFGRMEHAAKRMAMLIEDLLTYSHVSRGVSHLEAVDLNQKVKNVLEDLELNIQEKGAILHVAPLPVIQGHRRQLQQLFQNLIGNALKYAKPGEPPEIHITSQQVQGRATSLPLKGVTADKWYHLIQVRDNGIGFEQSDAERIFNVFTRLHGNAEYRGTGVGLSIAKKVIDNHHGYIWAESEPGAGATFRVLLPAE